MEDERIGVNWPANRIERRRVRDLVPYARNPMVHTPEHIADIAKSIEHFGLTFFPLIDENEVLIAGHARTLALELLGYSEIEIPVLVALGWSEDDKRAYRIADNQFARVSAWNDDFLRGDLRELKAHDFPLELTGFTGVQAVDFLSGIGSGSSVGRQRGAGSLAEQFGVPPFSVLNARDGWWQDRKRAWLALGIQSELGRGEMANDRSVSGSARINDARDA